MAGARRADAALAGGALMVLCCAVGPAVIGAVAGTARRLAGHRLRAHPRRGRRALPAPPRPPPRRRLLMSLRGALAALTVATAGTMAA
jgi:hypothetical protein